MKKNLIILAAVIISCFTSNQSVFAQGSLAPLGAPAPTMKSLDQIEARTPISSAPFTITQPGSYYLTTNLNVTSGNTITINTNQVTLDLNGFTISSTAASVSGFAIGLEIPAHNNDITIVNGHIVSGATNNGTTFSGTGFGFGIVINGGAVQNVRVANVTVSGCEYQGINLGTSNTVVESCTVQNSGIIGIEAQTVCRSTANQCGSTAIVASTASDCSGNSVISGGIGVQTYIANNCNGSVNGNGSGEGIYSFVANNCQGSVGGTGIGIAATTANNCYGVANGAGTGIQTTTAIGCVGFAGAGGTGIRATIANSCSSNTGDSQITHAYNMP